MAALVLSPRAADDLDEIWDHTARERGEAQAERYIRGIEATLGALAATPLLGVARDDVRAGYRGHPVGAHVVFYRVEGRTVVVVRILHGRMDAARHL